MTMLLFDLDGNLQNWPATDRAWQFGDGVFRTLYAEDGHVRDLVGQVAHLLHDAQLLHLQPLPAVGQLSEVTTKVVGEQGKFRLKWIISSGDSAGGYLRSGPARTMLALSPLPDDYRPPQQINAWRCETVLQPAGPWSAAKHLNRLDQVMARREQDPHVFPEGVMCDSQGHIASGISSNLFWVDRDQRLHTHPLDEQGVHGRTRARIIALAEKQGQPVALSLWKPEQFIDQAEEAFFCNSIWGCVPLQQFVGWSSRQTAICTSYNAGLGFS